MDFIYSTFSSAFYSAIHSANSIISSLNCSCFSIDTEKIGEELREIFDMGDNVIAYFSGDRINFSIENEMGMEKKIETTDCKIVEIVKSTFFDEGNENIYKPKPILYQALSRLSSNRKNFHEPEFFQHRLKRVYFRNINKEIVPYRYTLIKL
jgi:hypothetical protein